MLSGRRWRRYCSLCLWYFGLRVDQGRWDIGGSSCEVSWYKDVGKYRGWGKYIRMSVDFEHRQA